MQGLIGLFLCNPHFHIIERYPKQRRTILVFPPTHGVLESFALQVAAGARKYVTCLAPIFSYSEAAMAAPQTLCHPQVVDETTFGRLGDTLAQ